MLRVKLVLKKKFEMSQFFQSMATLLQAQFLQPTTAPQLILERLYYAEGRHHPQHPRHGSFEGLSRLSRP